jgi:hypothetical protein
MATTCKLIAKNVLGSNTGTVTFSSIPQTGYTDLLLVMSARSTRTPANTGQLGSLQVRPNGATTNLSTRWLRGNGSAAASSTDTALDFPIGPDDTTNWTANTFTSVEVYIPNYAGAANKSVSGVTAIETNGATSYIYVVAGLWSSTAAITSLDVVEGGANSFKSGSSFFLYGISKA